MGTFLRYFAEVAHPSAEVVEALVAAPNRWLAGVAQESLGRGSRLSAEVGLNVGGRRVQRRVDVSLGTPLWLPSATVIPVEWVDHSRAALFPKLRAELEVVGLGRQRCQLAINVRYDPPFGVVGTIADRALLHHVAEATVKDFLDHVAARVGELIASAQRTPVLEPDEGLTGAGTAFMRAAS